MAVDTGAALLLVKTRLNRTGLQIQQLDDYLTARIESAIQELEEIGIHLNDSTADLMLVVDYAVWKYNNRDSGEEMPKWLRLTRRERWLHRGDSP